MTDYKTLTNNHDYQIRFIKPSTGVTFTPPHLGGWYLNQLQDVGEAEILLPNGWVKDQETGIQKLVRTTLTDLIGEATDYVEIWRDSSLVWAGEIDDIDYDFTTIAVKCISHIDKLTEQLTGNESYTEEPATTVKRFLKGWDYNFRDDFDRTTGIGSDWTTYASTYYSIASNILQSAGVFYNEDAVYLNDARQGIKSASSYSYTIWDDAEISFDLSWNQGLDYIKFYFCFEASNTHLSVTIDFDSFITLNRRLAGVTTNSKWYNWSPSINTTYNFRIKTALTTTTADVTLFIDGINVLSDSYVWSDDYFPAYFGFQSRHGTVDVSTTINIDNFVFRKKKQVITEGTINNFGSSKTTSVSYETLYNSIDKRITKQCASSDDLAHNWEWKENPVAYVNSTTPCASLDFKNRIGSNKDVTLSIDEKNLKNFKSSRSKKNFATDVIALGAGTSQTEAAGQNMVRASDFDAYDSFGRIVEALYQLSEETNYTNLGSLATLWLGKRLQIHENIAVDPIDYEAKGFDVGDSYLLDIPKLLIDTSSYYRIMNEKREFSPEGAEAITVNWKDKSRSFFDAIREELRQLKNIARYGQGNYVTYLVPYLAENVATITNGSTRHFQFSSDMYLGVKQVKFTVHNNATSNGWKFYIDAVDRTSDIWGTATVTDDKYDFDITRFLTEVGVNHNVYIYNAELNTQNFATFGEALLYVRD